MARNIAQNGALTPRMCGTLKRDSQQIESVNKTHSRNRFDLSYQNLMSLRFGEVRPFFHQQCINDDTISFSNSSELWSMQMKSPLMSDFVAYKDYFYVPMKAILPSAWEAWKNNPIQEDDVPSDVYCNFPLGALTRLATQLVINYPTSFSSDTFLSVGSSLSALLFFYHFFSHNSLPVQLGINYSTCWSYKSLDDSFIKDSDQHPSIDQLLEIIFSGADLDPVPFQPKGTPIEDIEPLGFTLSTGFFNTSTGNPSVFIPIFEPTASGDKLQFNPANYRQAMQIIQKDIQLGINPCPQGGAVSTNRTVINYIIAGYKLLFDTVYEGNGGKILRPGYLVNYYSDSDTSYVPDFSPVYAYHLVGFQFFVNDQVDKVYTSFDYIKSLYPSFYRNIDGAPFFFDYNGHSIEYDMFSFKYTSSLIRYFIPANVWNYSATSFSSFSFMGNSLGFLLSIFVPFESLRFGDYYVGSRLNPLALGADPNSYAPVVSSEVKALDMVQAMSYLSYYNDIQKLGPTAWIQENGIFGDFPQSLDPMPRFISRSKVNIGEQQIENTSSENTGDIVTRSRSNDSSYGFSCDISESSIILGLISFDVPRIYQNVSDRLSFVKDRFDIFNPYFQNIGDQALLKSEINLNSSGNINQALGWQLRHTEYKQRVSVASGAFAGSYFLPSWAMVSDNRGFTLSEVNIRNHDYELDRFFVSLPNWTNSGYFHFYCRFYNRCEMVRAMQSKPDIQTPRIHQ